VGKRRRRARRRSAGGEILGDQAVRRGELLGLVARCLAVVAWTRSVVSGDGTLGDAPGRQLPNQCPAVRLQAAVGEALVQRGRGAFVALLPAGARGARPGAVGVADG